MTNSGAPWRVTLGHVAGRVPVYVGIGAISTGSASGAAEMARIVGCAGRTMLPLMFLSPNDEELYRYFLAVARVDRSARPSLYNNPDRMRVNLSASLVERLADVPNIVGVKDSSGDLANRGIYPPNSGAKGSGSWPAGDVSDPRDPRIWRRRLCRRDGQHRSRPRGGDLARNFLAGDSGKGPARHSSALLLCGWRSIWGASRWLAKGRPEPAGVPGRGAGLGRMLAVRTQIGRGCATCWSRSAR